MARPPSSRLRSTTPSVDYNHTPAHSPSPSAASDKENQATPRAAPRNKGKGRMPPPRRGNPSTSDDAVPPSTKRRRPETSRTATLLEDEEDPRKYYNPDQNPEERQRLKKKSRALEREFNDNRDRYLRSNDNGLQNTINRANSIFGDVKQTSDATLDSRLMVNVSDLLSKKSARMLLGDTSTGLDVDEFVSKCITFMRPDTGHAASTATQARRRRLSGDEDDDDQEHADYLDWARFGARACFASNSRPPVPAFLLGPLSVQKKARTQTQRRPRQARDNAGQEVRPEALTKDDLGTTETNTLTVICSKIRSTLQRHCQRAEAAVNEAGELTDELMTRLRVGETGGPHLFDFVINPTSFAQTVENIFYVSFLIKEGNVGIEMDSDGLPTLIPADQSPASEQREKTSRKHQAVFSIDVATWEKLVRAYCIREPLIEHRAESSTQVGSRGWYA
ncbi:hypothetical protein AAFC00_004056 [Neodothiora populina]|uniref:Non-structural maintenance of chromosomes element 4 n=1 Tax=Neodothiora populina TaxID=2781224 RepID=A0ABR3PIE4_9PEZI